MPSGFGGMGRGSDTRMYAPRSESSRMYASDDEDSYRHGAGDAEEQERRRDEKMRKREETKTVGDTPHLQIAIDQPEQDPMMGVMEEPQQEEDPNMYNPEQDAMASDMSAMAGALGTGGPDLSQALGAQTNGVMGGYRPLVATGEPMEAAWSTLMKADGKPFQQPKFEGPPGGRKPHIATSIRSKRQSRTLSPRTEHGGLTEAPLAVEMGHLGLSTKQPLRLFPAKYRQQLGQRHQRALMGNIAMPHQPHNVEQRTPTKPGFMGSGKIPRLAGEMASGKGRSKAVVKAPRPTDEFGNELPLHVQPESDRAAYIRYMQSLEKRGLPFPPNPLKPKRTMKAELQEMNTLLKSAKDYLHISQLRRMIRDLKKIVERQDRMKKAPLSRGSNKNKESNHRGETTNPQGGTDDPNSDEMSSSGSPGHVFAARGSGRVA
jgi:hypothetical protein